VTACPECAYTLKELYPSLTGEKAPYEVTHIAQYLREQREAGNLKLASRPSAAVFHDSCRLSRQLDVTEAPRETLREICGDELREMAHHGKNAVCCGTNGWLHCNATSRQIQDSRLREAADAGAKTLITACPKCQIHLRCAQASEADETLKRLEVRDLVSVAAEAIDGG
jgi:Fe-S oxidoreductase